MPVAEFQPVAEVVGIIRINCAKHVRQFIFNANPHLNEHASSVVGDHVGGDAPYDIGLANVKGHAKIISDILVRVRDNYVVEGKVNGGVMVSHLHGLVQG